MVVIKAANGVRSSCEMSATDCLSRAKARLSKLKVVVRRSAMGRNSNGNGCSPNGRRKSLTDTRLTA